MFHMLMFIYLYGTARFQYFSYAMPYLVYYELLSVITEISENYFLIIITVISHVYQASHPESLAKPAGYTASRFKRNISEVHYITYIELKPHVIV